MPRTAWEASQADNVTFARSSIIARAGGGAQPGEVLGPVAEMGGCLEEWRDWINTLPSLRSLLGGGEERPSNPAKGKKIKDK